MKQYFIYIHEEHLHSLFVTTSKVPPAIPDVHVSVTDAFFIDGSRDVTFHFSAFHQPQLSMSALRERIEAINATMDRTAEVDFYVTCHTLSYVRPSWRDALRQVADILEASWLATVRDLAEAATCHLSSFATSYRGDDKQQFRPYDADTYSSLHHLAQQVRRGLQPLTGGAFRPCCRSFLASTRCQGSDDDSLSH